MRLNAAVRLAALLASSALLSSAGAAGLTVFAAASLTDAFTEIGRNFDAQRGNTGGNATVFQFAGSQALRTQLAQGARADVYASASAAQYDPLVAEGTVAPGQTFAQNRLIIIAPKGNPKVQSIGDLTKAGVQLVLADRAVPVGDYTRRTFDLIGKAGTYGQDFAARALRNVVSEETNVRQVALKIQLGQGDAAVVYSSDVTPALRPLVRTTSLPTRFNPLAAYPIGVVRGSSNQAAAGAFVAYVLSPAGQQVLRKWGFVGAGR